MNTESTPSNVGGANALLGHLQESMRTQYNQYEESVRRAPLQAVGYAVLAGYVLRLLPIASIIAGLIRFAFAFLRPALLVFSAIKLFEAFHAQSSGGDDDDGLSFDAPQ